MTKIVRFLAVALGFVSVAVPSAAFAWNYDKDYPDSPGGGSANMRGSVIFVNKDTFDYNGTVRDVCPPDGYGASQYYSIGFTDNSTADPKPHNIVTSGCGTSESDSGRSVRGKNVSDIAVVGCYTDGGNPCRLVAIRTWFHDNPYT